MQPGDLVAERFQIEELAGGGGMGQIFSAREVRSGERLALKVLLTSDVREAERFLREALVLAGLSHPGIVRYVAHGQTSTGEPYLAMEWLDGEDLRQRLRRGRLGVAESVDLVRRIALALAEA